MTGIRNKPAHPSRVVKFRNIKRCGFLKKRRRSEGAVARPMAVKPTPIMASALLRPRPSRPYNPPYTNCMRVATQWVKIMGMTRKYVQKTESRWACFSFKFCPSSTMPVPLSTNIRDIRESFIWMESSSNFDRTLRIKSSSLPLTLAMPLVRKSAKLVPATDSLRFSSATDCRLFLKAISSFRTKLAVSIVTILFRRVKVVKSQRHTLLWYVWNFLTQLVVVRMELFGSVNEHKPMSVIVGGLY
mmetsp:Transcript_33621/g.40289  ORF Transcript_33621/g.40289 Transcript_33621/m.40289 type:complete len:244 (-) Transcript_33621:13-744(-)